MDEAEKRGRFGSRPSDLFLKVGRVDENNDFWERVDVRCADVLRRAHLSRAGSVGWKLFAGVVGDAGGCTSSSTPASLQSLLIVSRAGGSVDSLFNTRHYGSLRRLYPPRQTRDNASNELLAVSRLSNSGAHC